MWVLIYPKQQCCKWILAILQKKTLRVRVVERKSSIAWLVSVAETSGLGSPHPTVFPHPAISALFLWSVGDSKE